MYPFSSLEVFSIHIALDDYRIQQQDHSLPGRPPPEFIKPFLSEDFFFAVAKTPHHQPFRNPIGGFRHLTFRLQAINAPKKHMILLPPWYFLT